MIIKTEPTDLGQSRPQQDVTGLECDGIICRDVTDRTETEQSVKDWTIENQTEPSGIGCSVRNQTNPLKSRLSETGGNRRNLDGNFLNKTEFPLSRKSGCLLIEIL